LALTKCVAKVKHNTLLKTANRDDVNNRLEYRA